MLLDHRGVEVEPLGVITHDPDPLRLATKYNLAATIEL
jgi:hypothetical protein